MLPLAFISVEAPKSPAFPGGCVCVIHVSHSVVFNSLRPQGLYPARLLCPWNSPGKNTGVNCHSLLQRNFLGRGGGQLGKEKNIPLIRPFIFTLSQPSMQENNAPHLNPEDFPGGSDGKESDCNAGNLVLIPGSARSPGEGNGNSGRFSL